MVTSATPCGQLNQARPALGTLRARSPPNLAASQPQQGDNNVTGIRQALVAALDAIRSAHVGRVEADRVRAWKHFLLLPWLVVLMPERRAALC